MGNDPRIDNKIEELKTEQPSSTVERPSSETSPEKMELPRFGQEQRGAVLDEITQEDRAPKSVPAEGTYSGVGDEKNIKAIESILEEGLGDIYMKLPENKKNEFKKAGEYTAKEINKLINMRVKGIFWKVVKLIKGWLSIIPGVKNYFLEQEAKIKSDQILEEFHLKKDSR